MSAALPLSGDANADAFVERDALALLIGLVLDQQQPIERAFKAPWDLSERLGHPGVLAAQEIASMAPEALAAVFGIVPALHRFPNSMAERTQQLCQHLVATWDGNAQALWRDTPHAAIVLQRAKRLPGFGNHKAKVLIALLGKRLGVQLTGWRDECSPLGDAGTLLSIADIDSHARLVAYREVKKARKRTSPT